MTVDLYDSLPGPTLTITQAEETGDETSCPYPGAELLGLVLSLRRWFVIMPRDAGKDRAMVAAVVGHEAGNITDDVYSGGPSDTLRREVVESVRLPD